MTPEEIARILCEPDAEHSQFERAILLYGLQVAAVSPTLPQLALDARLHAAMKILEHIETAQGSPAGMILKQRLALSDYEKIIDKMLVRDEVGALSPARGPASNLRRM